MQRTGFIIFDGFQSMNLAALSVFEYANHTHGKPLYEMYMISENGGLIRSSTGMTVGTEAFDKKAFDTLIIGGHPNTALASSPGMLRYLRKGLKTARRIASVCVGAFKLAEAGILDGRRATTHWRHARELQTRYPKVQVEEDRIFVIDGSVWTSAGMTADIDLALAMVEKDSGADIARSVAQKLVLYHRRTGASHSIQHCWNWSPSRIAFKKRWFMPRQISTQRYPLSNWPKRYISVPGNLAVPFAPKQASPLPKR
jgi:transcriptional regulator GlxA family with amidase domain